MQANDEKLRLEEKQRQERNAVEAAGKPWESRWFQQVGQSTFCSIRAAGITHLPLVRRVALHTCHADALP